jgi:putative ATP-dependent endonuclease of OLD family
MWRAEGAPERQGFNVSIGDWSDEAVPWGAPNVAQFGRPEPHRVDAFADPKIQADEIVGLLKSILQQRLLAYTNTPGNEAGTNSDYEELLVKIATAQKTIVAEAAEEIQKVEGELSALIGAIFPNHVVRFDAKPEEDLDKSVQFFKSDASLLMGPENGYQSSVAVQGSGARRALLWTALKILANAPKARGKGTRAEAVTPLTRSHVLLIDEPEICLHPNAIREACKLLYDLPIAANWQVMATTHSPAFIDIARDNTTIIRVDRQPDGQVVGTTVFRPERAKLDDDDRARLKLLNVYDPYVAEFFFGGLNVIVEGDTEYTALRHLVANDPTLRRDVHVSRARGKETIVTLMKILNQFGASYAVLHDSDRPTRKDGKANSAWTANDRIRTTAESAPSASKVRVLAAVPNFEEAFFGKAVDNEKPYNAIEQLEGHAEARTRIKELFGALTSPDAPTPTGCVQWKLLADLEAALPAK